MSSRPSSYSAFFSVILISSTVFSLLSLPFFLYQTQPDANSSSLQTDFQPVLKSQNRDLTIRYIGAAMVVSVVTGIGTIELRRRRQAHLTASELPALPLEEHQELSGQVLSRQELSELAQASDDIDVLDDSEFILPDTLLLTSTSSFSQSSSPNLSLTELAEIETILEPAETVATLLQTTNPGNSDADIDADADADIDQWVQPQPQASIVELDRDYSICRIWVQHLRRRLLAVQVEGQFYSFFRLLPTQASARQIALQLSQNLHQTVITQVEQTYAVWVWQPDAELAQSTTDTTIDTTTDIRW